MNGATLAEIAEVLGHKTLQMVKRYAHLSETHKTSVVEKMNQAVFGRQPFDMLNKFFTSKGHTYPKANPGEMNIF